MNNNCILITGSEGFIGSALQEYFRNLGKVVICIDKLKNIKRVDYYCFDLSQDSCVDSIYNLIRTFKIETIIHCASPVGVDMILNDPQGTFDEGININNNINIICKKMPHCNLIFTSTSEVYGSSTNISISSEVNIDKQDKTKRYLYSLQKYLGELLFLKNSYNCIVLRLFNIVGPNQKTEKGVISKLINNMINDQEVNVDFDSTRSFLHISDFMKQFEYVFDNFKKLSNTQNIINIGDYDRLNYGSIGALFDLIENILQNENLIKNVKVNTTYNNMKRCLFDNKIDDLSFTTTKNLNYIIHDIINTNYKGN